MKDKKEQAANLAWRPNSFDPPILLWAGLASWAQLLEWFVLQAVVLALRWQQAH
jgi:hypothetical protein